MDNRIRTCYHCGEPLFEQGRWLSTVGAAQREMCCAGCQAVADAIVAAGLSDYYRTRTQPGAPGTGIPPRLVLAPGGRGDGATTPPDALDAPSDDTVSMYDEPEIQARFVRASGDSLEVTLLVEGIRCGACVWLIEQHLRAQAGVRDARVNLATERVSLRFDPTTVRLSELLSAAGRIGYRLRPFDAARREEALRKTSRDLFRRLFIAGLAMMQVMMYAFPAWITEPGEIEVQWDSMMRWASLALTLPVLLYSAQPFFVGAWRDLRARSPGMDVPVAIALIAAFAASVHATFTGRGEVWFDSITMFVFLLLGARYLEWMARRRAARALDQLSASLPETAERIDPLTGAAERVPAVRLVPGDRFRVAPGERIALDAELIDEATTIDQSLLTGESRPVPVRRGDPVPGGAVNTGHPVVLRALRAAGDSTISTIERLAERAAANRPQLVSATDRVARLFVLALLVLSAVVWLVWLQLDPSRAGQIAIAVLVVSCPCALSLATPAALAAAIGNALRRGMLLGSGDALLRAADVTDVVFDKTGTLTVGRPELVALTPLSEARERLACPGHRDPAGDRGRETLTEQGSQLLAIAAALEIGQPHPVAEAIRRAAASLALPSARDARTLPGLGVQAHIDGRLWRLGNAAFTGAPREPDILAASQATVVWLADERGPLARLHFQDRLRDEAGQVVASLAARGLRVHLLSGDHPETVAAFADVLQIPDYLGGAAPDAKLAYVQVLQRSGRCVMMVGDGINDAPVLAAADVSVAVGDASALARTSAGVVLLGRSLSDLESLLSLAGNTRRIVAQNLGWAMLYNAAAIPAAALGWVPPALAAIGMSVSSLVVAVNALRLMPKAGTARAAR